METPASTESASSLKGYAITISVNGKLGQLKHNPESTKIKGLLRSKWMSIMDQLEPTTSDYIYEVSDKSTKVHLHGMFATKVPFKYKHLQSAGLQIYCRELKTPQEETNWYYYIHKDVNLFEDQQADTAPDVANRDKNSKKY